MTAPTLTMPTKTLLDGAEYTPACATDIRKRFEELSQQRDREMWMNWICELGLKPPRTRSPDEPPAF